MLTSGPGQTGAQGLPLGETAPGQSRKRLLQLREAEGGRLRGDQGMNPTQHISAVLIPRAKKIGYTFSLLCTLLKICVSLFGAVAGFRQSLGKANLSVIPQENPPKGQASVTVPQHNPPQVVPGLTRSGVLLEVGVWSVSAQPQTIPS